VLWWGLTHAVAYNNGRDVDVDGRLLSPRLTFVGEAGALNGTPVHGLVGGPARRVR